MRSGVLPPDPETGLRDVTGLLYDLGVGRHERRAIDLISFCGGEGPEEPFALSDDHDALGARTGQALRQAAAQHGGAAYRVSGGLFAIVTRGGGPERRPAEAVHAQLEAFAPRHAARLVHARVVVPDEAPPGRAALRIAFGRLRARSGWQPHSAARQARDVLLELMAERRMATDVTRRRNVVGHAVAVGRRLGLAVDELEEVVRAAELQDVGLLTLPDDLLRKSSPLTAAEWALVRSHPCAGERILRAAPSLVPVARLVRSACERFDGSGYPDGLKGEAIPLGSRIVAVCVAFDAMTSPRPYRPARSADETVAELRACAGRQFDPQVVEAFAEVAAPAAHPVETAA